jgi:hypothetical protein
MFQTIYSIAKEKQASKFTGSYFRPWFELPLILGFNHNIETRGK